MTPMKYDGNCIEYTLGPAALDFIREERLAVGHTLAKLLLQSLDLHSGRVSVFFPPGLSVDQLQLDFEGGGMLPFPPESEGRRFTQDDGMKVVVTPVPQVDSDLIAIIMKHIQTGDEPLCIMENAMVKPSYPAASDSETQILVFRDEVYHLVRGGLLSARYIRRAIGKADSGFMLIGALTSLPRESAILPTEREIAVEKLRLMAERTVKVFTVAYDGEGYLIWHRPKT